MARRHAQTVGRGLNYRVLGFQLSGAVVRRARARPSYGAQARADRRSWTELQGFRVSAERGRGAQGTREAILWRAGTRRPSVVEGMGPRTSRGRFVVVQNLPVRGPRHGSGLGLGWKGQGLGMREA